MTDQQERWIARLTPLAGTSSMALLQLPLGLDVWQRDATEIIVVATAGQLEEIARRRLAHVERLETVAAYLARQQPDDQI